MTDRADRVVYVSGLVSNVEVRPVAGGSDVDVWLGAQRRVVRLTNVGLATPFAVRWRAMPSARPRAAPAAR